MNCEGMDHYRRSSLHAFTALSIDRAHGRRKDKAWLGSRLSDPSTLFVPLLDTRNLFSEEEVPRPVFLTAKDAADLGLPLDSASLLGMEGDRAYFALDLTGCDAATTQDVERLGAFRDLKILGPLLAREESGLLAYARAMVYWHARHRFCGDCGSPTASEAGGHLRICSNVACGRQHFPRTDPAVIALVTDGERCLLGRQRIWPKLMHSVIAGFVEPGESLEDAVVREVYEETGVRVVEARYHSSQPWPFPASIMLGFTATARSGTIRLNDGELEDAQWFSREDIERGIARESLRLPSRISIALHLIEDWFDSGGPVRLRDLTRMYPNAISGGRRG